MLYAERTAAIRHTDTAIMSQQGLEVGLVEAAALNLRALQRIDKRITSVTDTAMHVAVYRLQRSDQTWKRGDIEGTLFVVNRKGSRLPNRFIILNRLGVNNLVQDIRSSMKFERQGQYLFFQNGKRVVGLWFYQKKECARIFSKINKLIGHSPSKKAHMRDSEAEDAREFKQDEILSIIDSTNLLSSSAADAAFLPPDYFLQDTAYNWSKPISLTLTMFKSALFKLDDKFVLELHAAYERNVF